MKKITKLGTMALVGIMGMGLATTPVSAAPAQKTTDVFYTTSSAGVDADGKVVMVVPAAINLTKEEAEKTLEVSMQTSDPNVELPENFTATVNVTSANKGKLKDVTSNKSYDYKLIKDQKDIDLKTDALFNTFSVSGPGSQSAETQATVKVEKASVKEMEKEAPGTVFKDTLTFTVKNFSGSGLTQK